MTDEMRKILTDAGMDVDAALERFMNNENLMEKFLKKFRNEPTFKDLKKAIENRDLDACFRAAHTLKGVTANFSFEKLRSVVSDQTEEFRAGKLDEGIEMMPAVVEEYERVCSALTDLYGEE